MSERRSLGSSQAGADLEGLQARGAEEANVLWSPAQCLRPGSRVRGCHCSGPEVVSRQKLKTNTLALAAGARDTECPHPATGPHRAREQQSSLWPLLRKLDPAPLHGEGSRGVSVLRKHQAPWVPTYTALLSRLSVARNGSGPPRLLGRGNTFEMPTLVLRAKD